MNFYEGNFALQDFSILSKNTKIYEGNIALQGFLFFGKKHGFTEHWPW